MRITCVFMLVVLAVVIATGETAQGRRRTRHAPLPAVDCGSEKTVQNKDFVNKALRTDCPPVKGRSDMVPDFMACGYWDVVNEPTFGTIFDDGGAMLINVPATVPPQFWRVQFNGVPPSRPNSPPYTLRIEVFSAQYGPQLQDTPITVVASGGVTCSDANCPKNPVKPDAKEPHQIAHRHGLRISSVNTLSGTVIVAGSYEAGQTVDKLYAVLLEEARKPQIKAMKVEPSVSGTFSVTFQDLQGWSGKRAHVLIRSMKKNKNEVRRDGASLTIQ